MITHEEWASLLAGAAEPVIDGLTAGGWAERLKVSDLRATRWVKDGLEAGWLEHVTIVRPTISGFQRRTVGFRVNPREGE